MAFELHISPGSSSPIFRQIVDQVRLAAATGKLAVADQLPSVRALAERLVVNPNTIAKAYAELSRAGILESRPGKGLFIAAPREVYTREERLRRIEPMVDALVNEGVALGLTREELLNALTSRLDEVGGDVRSLASSQDGGNTP